MTIISEMPEKKTRYEWHYLDIEEYIQKHWGQKWEGGASMGFPAQDTYHDVDVDGWNEDEIWMEGPETIENAEAIINKFKAEGMPRKEYAEPGVELVLNWLNREGRIPSGKYRVLVWW